MPFLHNGVDNIINRYGGYIVQTGTSDIINGDLSISPIDISYNYFGVVVDTGNNGVSNGSGGNGGDVRIVSGYGYGTNINYNVSARVITINPLVRFVKLLHTGDPATAIVNINELEVFGLFGTTNLALNKTVTVSASGYYNDSLGPYDGTKLVDGNLTNMAHTAVGGTDAKFLMVDLGANYEISRVKVTNRTTNLTV